MNPRTTSGPPLRVGVTVAALAFGAIASATVTNAQSTVLTGNQLYATCEKGQEDPLYAFCTGYVIGYVEGRNWGGFTVINRLIEPDNAAKANELNNQLVGHCVPEDANYQQLMDVAVSYMQKHPESRHESARTLIWLSFIEAFPCAN